MPCPLLRAGAAALLLAATGCESGGGGDGDSNGGIAAGLSAAGPSGDTSETGTTATFTVVLDEAPSAVVTVNVTSDDPGEIAIQNGAALTFAPGDWDTPQTVTVAGVNDEIPDGAVTVTVTATANTAGGYDGERATVMVVNQDDGRELAASRDNTLYEENAGRSNGAGQHLYTGLTAGTSGENLRRLLVAFDIPPLPPGAALSSATLRLTQSRRSSQLGGDPDVGAHRMLVDWGEAGSDPPGVQEGEGAAAQTGDATWSHRFFGTDTWSNATPGGEAGTDFLAGATDIVTLDVNRSYDWDVTTDVQQWLAGNADNFGWMLIHVNESATASARQFNSREHPALAGRPVLLLEY